MSSNSILRNKIKISATTLTCCPNTRLKQQLVGQGSGPIRCEKDQPNHYKKHHRCCCESRKTEEKKTKIFLAAKIILYATVFIYCKDSPSLNILLKLQERKKQKSVLFQKGLLKKSSLKILDPFQIHLVEQCEAFASTRMCLFEEKKKKNKNQKKYKSVLCHCYNYAKNKDITHTYYLTVYNPTIN